MPIRDIWKLERSSYVYDSIKYTYTTSGTQVHYKSDTGDLDRLAPRTESRNRCSRRLARVGNSNDDNIGRPGFPRRNIIAEKRPKTGWRLLVIIYNYNNNNNDNNNSNNTIMVKTLCLRTVAVVADQMFRKQCIFGRSRAVSAWLNQSRKLNAALGVIRLKSVAHTHYVVQFRERSMPRNNCSSRLRRAARRVRSLLLSCTAAQLHLLT